MSEKQTTFFTINCAENLESPNQCMGLIFGSISSLTDILFVLSYFLPAQYNGIFTIPPNLTSVKHWPHGMSQLPS
jgi:hypothetical protein